MAKVVGFRRWWGGVVFCVAALTLHSAERLRVATYNLDNYIIRSTATRRGKPAESRVKIREVLTALNADVLALQEVGGESALLELQSALSNGGVHYPFHELVYGADTNIQVALLSKFAFTARRAHTNDAFLLFGRKFRVCRGFAEVDVQVNPRYTFTIFSAHLKSRREVPEADEMEWREQEAIILRRIINARLQADPRANVVVLGDFNDTKNSRTIRSLIGRGRTKLVDTRPAERNGDHGYADNPRWDPRNVTWTHYFGTEDTYSRIDYILLSPGMAKEWIPDQTYVLTVPDWGMASDHRPIVASFIAEDH